MAQLIASVVSFALGILFLPTLIPGMRISETSVAFRSGLVGGVLSVLLSKLLVVLLTLVFFLPIVISGPIGVFVVQAAVNAVLLFLTAHFSQGLEFDRVRTTVWAALALTALQTIVRLI